MFSILGFTIWESFLKIIKKLAQELTDVQQMLRTSDQAKEQLANEKGSWKVGKKKGK